MNKIESAIDNSVDGQSWGVSAANQKALAASDPSAIKVEMSELQRKIEKKDIELKKREKDGAAYAKEILRLQNQLKANQVDIQTIKERNEQLDAALSYAKSSNVVMSEETQARYDSNRIRELEDTILMSKHKIIRMEEALDKEKARHIEIEVENKELNQIVISNKEEIKRLNNKVAEFPQKINELSKLNMIQADQISRLEKEISSFNEKESMLKGIIDCQNNDLNDCKNTISKLEKDIVNMKRDLELRNETNITLVSQFKETNGNSVTIFEDELKKYQTIEIEYVRSQSKIEGLIKSVDLHLNLLQKSETENKRLAQELADSTEKADLSKRESDVHLKAVARSEVLTKKLKNDILKLQREVKEVTEENESLKRDPFGKDEAVKNMRNGLATLTKSKQEEIEEKLNERKKRKSAEEAAKAMRNRVSFLLEQLEQATGLAKSWQEQKNILKAEIGALYKTNSELRERLNSMQKSYVERHISQLKNSGQDVSSYLKEGFLDEASDNKPIDPENGKTIPTSTEAIVERALFDTLCAFTSGIRNAKSSSNQNSNSISKLKSKSSKGMYKAITTDGRQEIVFDNDVSVSSSFQAEPDELLSTLQIPIFLKFVQSRSEEKSIYLFCEKLASILNYILRTTNEMAEQVADARMIHAKQQSKSINAVNKCDKMKAKLVKERIAKQKSTLKLIREQLKFSDIRLIMDKVYAKSKDELAELEGHNAILNENNPLRFLLRDIVDVAEYATVSSSSSGTVTGPIGALEIRLPETQLDDETLHGVFTLLSGYVPTRHDENQNASKPKAPISNFTSYFDRILLLNLKDNCLTDLSAKLLASLVERSNDLRMLDLRGNHISHKGASCLFEAIKHNHSVLFVTQRQGGFMLEGHREITAKEGENLTTLTYQEPKHPLRIDIRLNTSTLEDIEEILDSVDIVPIKQELLEISQQPIEDEYAEEKMKPVPTGEDELFKENAKKTYNPNAYREGNKEYTVGTWTAHGLREDLTKRRPQSASAARDKYTEDFSEFYQLSAGKPPRPKTAQIKSPSPTGNRDEEAGSLLDKHIRKMQQEVPEFKVPIIKPGISGRSPSPFDLLHKATSTNDKKQQTFNVYTTKINHSDFNAKQIAAVTTSDLNLAASGGMQGLISYSVSGKKKRRPVSAGSIKPEFRSLKNLQVQKAPSENLFSSKSSLDMIETNESYSKTNKTTKTKNEINVTKKSSAFSLLDDLHKMNSGILY